jgi:transglutaminase-like putative cysteine protease
MGSGIIKRAMLVAAIVLAAASSLRAQTSPTPPYEIVKDDIDMEAAPDGRFWELVEVHYRPLTSQGVEALQKITLSYTAGYESLKITTYTLKKDGRRIDIPAGSILQGHGETTSPGFEDTRTMTVVFPNLEIGDQAVLIKSDQQLVPWFPNIFAATQLWPPEVPVKEATLAFTTQGTDSSFHITSQGVSADPAVSAGGKTRHVWHYQNDNPAQPEPEAVNEIAGRPHVAITTLPDYSGVADIYAGVFKDRAEVTPDISSLANQLTTGVRDHRAQAKILYEWVAAHIRYVNIVLGAGGFIPHKAADVLKNGYGDCKDHVMLLQALLAARDIKSSPVLIRAGVNQYQLPAAPSPFLFDHLITYVPEFRLYLDSTARFAAFGVLPSSDAGKTVVVVATGKTAVTPPIQVGTSSIASSSSVMVNADGSADTQTSVTATGAAAVELRGMMAAIAPDQDTNFFRTVLGPGGDGRFTRGDPEALGDSYAITAKYHTGHIANFPGPGALPAALTYKPFSFTMLVGQTLPQTRASDYACSSGTFRDDVTTTLPASAAVANVPPGKTFTTDGVMLETSYETPAPNVVKEHVLMKLDRPGPVCRAGDYARIRPELANMVGGLMAQILYK